METTVRVTNKPLQSRPKTGELWVGKDSGAISIIGSNNDYIVIAPGGDMKRGYTGKIGYGILKPFEGTVTITQEL